MGILIDSNPQQLVWLITGTSSGIGRHLALEVLKRGDRVIATARARSMPQLQSLAVLGADVLELDVTDSPEHLKEIAKKAVALHGHVDVVVNNAGISVMGSIEEHTLEESYQQFNTNFFGGVSIARAFLPYMRERRSGTILWIGSLAGWTPSISFGMYSAAKHAVRGISETLNAEISHLGLRSHVVELGYFSTNIIPNRIPYVPRISDYNEIIGQADGYFDSIYGHEPGDPAKAATIIVDLVRGEGVAEGKTVPSVLGLGADYYKETVMYCENMMKRLTEWESVIRSTDF